MAPFRARNLSAGRQIEENLWVEIHERVREGPWFQELAEPMQTALLEAGVERRLCARERSNDSAGVTDARG